MRKYELILARIKKRGACSPMTCEELDAAIHDAGLLPDYLTLELNPLYQAFFIVGHGTSTAHPALKDFSYRFEHNIDILGIEEQCRKAGLALQKADHEAK